LSDVFRFDQGIENVTDPSCIDQRRKRLDPVTFEVLSHKIEEVVAEMYHTIGWVSGNPIVFESGDHQEGIFDANGEAVMFGGGIVEWTYALQAGAQHLTQEYEDNPGIYDGDQFLLNHAYVAAVHAMDIQLLAPVFWEGKRVAWVVTAGHQLDVGGMDWGGFSVGATEIYQEGLQIPGLKIVENGRVRKDVEEMIRTMTRTPDLGMLDIYSKIAANNVARARLLEILERYGLETVLTLFDQMRDYSEQQARERLRQIPDGSWSHVMYMESLRSEERYLRCQVMVRKEGDRLTLDFTGTSPQSVGSQNLSAKATISNAFCPYLTLLCPDIQWTGGLYRPVEFVLPESTLVNPDWPTATSHNTAAGGGYLVIMTVHAAISKMMLSCDLTRDYAFAPAGPALHAAQSSGIDKDGNFFIFIPMESLAGGMGGGPQSDGINSGANMWTPKTQIANVETNELLYPIMYLYRQEIQDSAGAGRHRGGVTQGYAYIPWGSRDNEITTRDHGHGAEPRMGIGLGGGYPAPNSPMFILRNSNVRAQFDEGQVPGSIDEMLGESQYTRTGETNEVHEQDVLVSYQGGGGGYGDPIERDPELVLKDIIDGYVSAQAATDLYGVIAESDGSSYNKGATEKRREEIRNGRLERGTRRRVWENGSNGRAASVGRLGDNLEVVAARGQVFVRCIKCQSPICPVEENYKDYVLTADVPAAHGQPARFVPTMATPFVLREYCCPRCAIMFEVDMVMESDGPVASFILNGNRR
jgi:N-methylhydantoinase B